MSDKIENINIKEEMENSFLEYAFSVIYARALPDARDGLKPVQRRIIFQMREMGLDYNKPFVKSARIVGDVMGKLHPHGDSAIYDAMVRLAQDFSLRMPLIEGHGNFGTPDDRPAAARYTEARPSMMSNYMVEDINEDTVDFVPNYDNKLKEPDVLPSAIPNLLINGAMGIAVGMATNMAPHNLNEVMRAAVHLMKNPNCSLDDLMKFVPAPDLPGGGIIVGTDGIRQAYETGRGAFITRAKTSIEKIKNHNAIVVTELPYTVGGEKVIERIKVAIANKKVQGIATYKDLTDRNNGTRVVITIKNGFNPKTILNKLYSLTPLEESFSINNVALVEGKPLTLGLKQLLDVWCKHRIDVILRRTKYRLQSNLDRLHLLQGLLIAIVDIDKVIHIIRNADDQGVAKTELKSAFKMDDLQAEYILELKLRRLTKFSKLELENNIKDLEADSEYLRELISNKEKLTDEVIRLMLETSKKLPSERRTKILSDDKEIEAEIGYDEPIPMNSSLRGPKGRGNLQDGSDLGEESFELPDTPCSVILTTTGMIQGIVRPGSEVKQAPKKVEGTLFEDDNNQDAGENSPSLFPFGKEGVASSDDGVVLGGTESDGVVNGPGASKRYKHDTILNILKSSTRGEIGVLTNLGRIIRLKVDTFNIEEAEQQFTGFNSLIPLDKLVELEKFERPINIVSLISTAPIAIGTSLGTVKRVNMDTLYKAEEFSAITLKEGDEVIGAGHANDNDELVFIAEDSSLLRFPAAKVRPQGVLGGGMAGIRLADGVKVSSFSVITNVESAKVVTVASNDDGLAGTDFGAGKVTPLALYPEKGRGTGGVRSQRFLKGETIISFSGVSLSPLGALNFRGNPTDLPEENQKRDASGVKLKDGIGSIGVLIS
jgi:DNA gyrase subunit A